jgi:hypothetical protein
MRLVRCGIPFDVAESWSEEERAVNYIISYEQDGHKFDFNRYDWIKAS